MECAMKKSGYLIELFSHKPKIDRKCYAWTKHHIFLTDIKSLELNQEIVSGIFFTLNSIYEEEILDLFEATVIHNKLTSLGVKCAIVEVNYA